MDDNEQILAELRKISGWADMQRKITRWTFVVIAVAVPLIAVVGFVLCTRVDRSLAYLQATPRAEEVTWSEFDRSMRRSDMEEAVRIGEILIQKAPQYSEGHHRLALAYLAAGKMEKAKEHFDRAYQLFPSEENGSILNAIQRRLDAEKSASKK